MAQAGGPGPLAEDGEGERPKWDNKAQYLLSCIGFAVGLGNIWRFPYLCQTHGGGAFLIPYLVALAFEGIPLFHIELAIGQRLRRGSIGVWRAISPYLSGIGFGCFTVSFVVSLYYNTVLTWVLWFFLNSFQHPLPWSTCPLDLNTTGFVQECQASSTVNYFWYRQTLNITADISHGGVIQWRLLLCLVTCWAVVYLCVIRGIESTGKAIYFTASFPYLVLTIFLIRGLTLPGAAEGLTYLFTPKMRTLQNPRVWLDAATQIFFSLSLAFGGHIAFASYNPPRNNCEKDAVVISLVNSLTSLYASITIFSIMGFKATNDYRRCLDSNILSLINEFDFPEQSISRDDYVTALKHLNATCPERVARLSLKACHLEDFLDKSASGPGLAFLVFTEAVLHMPGASAWAVLFFGMLFTLGLSSMFGNMEGIITPLLDMGVLPRGLPKDVLTGLVCLLCLLCSTCFTLQSGSYWLEIFDSFVASLNLLIFAFCEVVGVIYVYGMKRFCDDIEWMTGRRPNLYWRVTWRVVSPVLLLGIFLSCVILLAQRPPSYKAWNPHYGQFPLREEKLYPGWVQVTCVLLSFLPVMWVPAIALVQLLARCRQRRKSTGPDRSLKL
ncbi:sodium-dependent neutral amino acid transporter B(0)AT3-like [Perognathus longimembris pacificus]|uniref:sodium-dependent neutral amino acid transporter B(0)AT3-like n=1 Tax=Perognathus longimembris pacificus TaxID=214514 RepID=UPI0020197860|nr:sodium-dependent neutral amino acid transporter B(0)AT3-like [Perognathus longimembris pacificus]XP_048193292.1 sodium-dependent neutral amino acid transporter B(0)AT3-like [Perognathus longimembris pacificus]